MDQTTTLTTPWGAIVLMVLGLVLFYGAGAIDTGRPMRFRRGLTRTLLALSGVSLVGAVLAAMIT